MSDLRHSYLKAMGIDVWARRDLPAEEPQPAEALAVETGIQPKIEDETVATATPEIAANQPASDLEPPPIELDALEPVIDNEYEQAEPAATGLAALDWPALKERVAAGTLCELHQSHTRTVFGVGDVRAEILIIGEAPGADEDRQGEPFVGKAGQLLNAMLKAIGLSRQQVYIANILKCRPPNNRDPRPEEALQCQPYLQRQIELIQPTLILALGRIAAQRLLQTSTSLARMRGQIHRLESTGTPLLVTYHPAYLLRSPAEKRKAWDDLKTARQFVARKRQESAS